MEKLIKVSILGRDYTIKSDEQERYIQQLAEYINQKLGEITDKGVSNPVNTLILAAFTIADDFHKLKGRQNDFISRVENKMMELERISKGKE